MKNIIVRPEFRSLLTVMRAVLWMLFPPFMALYVIPLILIAPRSFLSGVGFTALIAVPIFSLIIYFTKSLYKGARFTINETSVRYDLDFILYTKKKEILFKNIKEVELRANALQKIFGFGSIILHTHATATQNRPSGITLYDLEDPEGVYDLIQQKVSIHAQP